MIQNMYIQNGGLDTISEVKKYFKLHLFKSLRFRIVLIVILVGVIPGLIMKTVILNSYENRAVEVRTAEIQNQCTILCNQVSSTDFMDGVTSEEIETELAQLTSIYNGRVMIIDQTFHIERDTYDMDTGKTIVSENVVRCFNGKGTSGYDSKNKYIEITSPIFNDREEVIGVMLVSVCTDTIADCLEVLNDRANIVLLTVTVIVALLAFLFGYLIVRPFKRVTGAIEAVSDGYEEAVVKEDAYVETIKLSEAFNKALARMRALDDSRNEFVSNVSHELKTPLASMKVLADSLLIQGEAPVELYQEFMKDLSGEIERENQIINDLLSLVKMDKTANNMNITQENMNELVEKVLKRLRPIAREHNIEVVFESFRPVTAEVDEMKLSLALTNLVENAIKYNKEEGWVHVSLNADHKFCYIEVADSGIGIPEESIDHIFERFYRVDKSHSREIGGTGLGLAIARSAIVMHRGAIKVYSQPGEGTTFAIRLPLTYVA